MIHQVNILHMENEERLAIETYFNELGIVVLLIKRLHFEAKKLLK